MSPLQGFVSIKDLLDQVFLKTHGKQFAVMGLQFRFVRI